MGNRFIKNLIGGVKHRFHQNRHSKGFSWFSIKILKHQNNSSIKNITVNGLAISYKQGYGLYHTYTEIFVREIYKFNTENAHPVIIDCGANIGISVLYFAKNYPDAKIIAFEPDAGNYQVLKSNIDNNRLNNKNIGLIQKAVWINNDGITFHAEGTEGSKIAEDDASAFSVYVETQRLKELLATYAEIDFLKIDIEGAEYAVIKDCREDLYKVENLFLEYHGLAAENYKLKELLDILDYAKFSVYVNTASDSIKKPFVEKKSKNDFDVQLNIFCYRSN